MSYKREKFAPASFIAVKAHALMQIDNSVVVPWPYLVRDYLERAGWIGVIPTEQAKKLPSTSVATVLLKENRIYIAANYMVLQLDPTLTQLQVDAWLADHKLETLSILRFATNCRQVCPVGSQGLIDVMWLWGNLEKEPGVIMVEPNFLESIRERS